MLNVKALTAKRSLRQYTVGQWKSILSRNYPTTKDSPCRWSQHVAILRSYSGLRELGVTGRRAGRPRPRSRGSRAGSGPSNASAPRRGRPPHQRPVSPRRTVTRCPHSVCCSYLGSGTRRGVLSAANPMCKTRVYTLSKSYHTLSELALAYCHYVHAKRHMYGSDCARDAQSANRAVSAWFPHAACCDRGLHMPGHEGVPDERGVTEDQRDLKKH